MTWNTYTLNVCYHYILYQRNHLSYFTRSLVHRIMRTFLKPHTHSHTQKHLLWSQESPSSPPTSPSYLRFINLPFLIPALEFGWQLDKLDRKARETRHTEIGGEHEADIRLSSSSKKMKEFIKAGRSQQQGQLHKQPTSRKALHEDKAEKSTEGLMDMPRKQKPKQVDSWYRKDRIQSLANRDPVLDDRKDLQGRRTLPPNHGQSRQLLLFNHYVVSESFATPWTVALQAPLSTNFAGKNIGVGGHFLLQEIFLTQGLNPRLLLGRQTFTTESTRKPKYSIRLQL